MANLMTLDVNLIDFTDDRIDGGAGDIETLARNISENGLLAPIAVVRDGERYRIIAGRRRFRAVRDVLELKEIQCTVFEPEEVDETSAGLSENLVRLDMDALDMARSVKKLLDAGKDAKEISLLTGISQRQIAHLSRLSRLSPEWIAAFKDKNLNLETASRLAELSPELQKEVYEYATGNGLASWAVNMGLSRACGDRVGQFSCGDCEICATRTHLNDQTLFPDMQTVSDLCLNHDCYMKKWRERIEVQWKEFTASHPGTDCSSLDVVVTGTFPSEEEGEVTLDGKVHSVVSYNDISDILEDYGWGDDEDDPEKERFVAAVEAGNRLYAIYRGDVAGFRLAVEEPESECYDVASDAINEIREDVRRDFSWLPESEREEVEAVAVSTPTWSSENPRNMFTADVASELTNTFRRISETDTGSKAVACIIADTLSSEEQSRIFPGVEDAEDDLSFMAENIDEDKAREVYRTFIRSRISIDRYKLKSKNLEAYDKLLKLAGLETDLENIRRNAALRVYSQLNKHYEDS